ncbi:MAG TPA: hypothetical protein VIZ00_08670, partial [Streptosporangiaceae bacterium]
MPLVAQAAEIALEDGRVDGGQVGRLGLAGRGQPDEQLAEVEAHREQKEAHEVLPGGLVRKLAQFRPEPGM